MLVSLLFFFTSVAGLFVDEGLLGIIPTAADRLHLEYGL